MATQKSKPASRKTAAARGKTGGGMMLALLFSLVLVVGLTASYWCWMRRVATCKTKNLSLSTGHTEGTAGTIYTHAVLTNNGPKCSLGGYPAAFLTDAGGTVLGSGAATNPVYPPVTVTLGHGQMAHAVLGFPDAGNFSPGVCSAASTYLHVYPPGSTSVLQTALAEHSCPGFSVTALQAGA